MTRLRIALQKSGRLAEGSCELLRTCGLRFEHIVSSSRLRLPVTNFPLDLLFVRDDDIPHYVADGVADLGIVGENVIGESDFKVTVVQKLDFAHCRLALAVPKDSKVTNSRELSGKKIATSYPKLLQQFLSRNGTQAEIHRIRGSVEIAPSIGLADAICDLVGSGSTLLMNGLREIEEVLSSEAVLIESPHIDRAKNELVTDLRFRFESVLRAKGQKYLLLNAPERSLEEVLALLPALRSPTVIPLATTGWYSMHSVVEADTLWEKVRELKAAGAEGILVGGVEQLIP